MSTKVMSTKGTPKISLPKLDHDINLCMIKDRYGFSKQRQNKKKNHAGLKPQIDKSIKLVERRRASVPVIKFPAELPVSGRADEIEKFINNNQVIIISGETGSGKTTQLPKICLKAGRGIYGKIGHTQPRRVAARTVAGRIAEELGVSVGNEIGYQVRFSDHSTEQTLVKVMTDGILLSETQRDRFLESYDTLIIDEAHERSLNIDFLLGYLKRILPKRPDLKVIITSATIDVERFSTHFNQAPIFEVSGRAYPVETLYRPPDADSKTQDADELIQEGVLNAVKEVEQISSRAGDFLVFLPGEREIRDMALFLRKEKLKNTEILPLYSRLSVAEQNKIFRPHPQRRIVLATNVAETSITVPGIGYVIDPGLARISRYSSRSKIQQLPVEKISQASADQRKGRCGRISEGVCIRLYSEEDFISRPLFTQPEILRTNLAAVILQMLALKLGDISHFPFVEKPLNKQINDGFNLLKELGAVDNERRITRTGKDLAKIPIDLRFGKMILQAGKEGSLKEILLIVSALAIQDPRERPYDHQQAADRAHEKYKDDQSDFLALINLWNAYEVSRQELTQKQLRHYCHSHFLSYLRLREWREIHRQLTLVCKEMNIKLNSLPADYMAVHKAILSGLLGNIGEKYQQSEYLGGHNRKHFIFPGSSQFKRQPKWIASAELVETSRIYGRMVAEIEPDWVESLAPHLLKRHFDEPHFSAKRGQVMAYERVTIYGLTLADRRLVDFGAIDLMAARQIFIQAGLIERQLKSKLKFYLRNIELMQDLEKMESKTRRRDLLIDTYTIYQFYEQRLPPHVCSQFELENWAKSQDQARLLIMTKDMLMREDKLPDQWIFPDEIAVQQAHLKLDYKFEPQKKDDGISINVPVSLLGQVPSAQLDWMVPGLLREKCLALMKSLPKNLRKHFVPAPQVIDKIIDKVVYDGRSLRETLGEQLYKLKGVKVPLDAWSENNLDDHLLMNIRVVDQKGEVLGEGRQLGELVRRFQQDSGIAKSSPHQIERKGIITWDFDELPEYVEFEQVVTIKGYPALVDQGNSVSIEVIDTPQKALKLSQQGSLRLIMLELSSQVKYVSKNIPGFEDSCLLYATRGGREELLKEMVEAIFKYTFIEDQSVVRTRSEFLERLEARQNLISMVTQVGGLVGNIFGLAQDIGLLINRLSDKMPHAVEDIRAQLDRLLSKGFLTQTPISWLKQYPRYLKAVAVRLDKLQGNKDKDKSKTLEVQSFCQRLESLDPGYWSGNHPAGQSLSDQSLSDQSLSDQSLSDHSLSGKGLTLKWMIEELRVSLFAQSLGTKVPVSAKRLDKQFLDIESTVNK